MKTDLTVEVALSPELLAHLWAQSRKLEVPLQWLIAGLVCDTVDSTQSVVPVPAFDNNRAVA